MWIVEKFRSWTDGGGDIESVISRNEIVTNIILYWATSAIGSSFWPYYARIHGPWPIPEGAQIAVPTGYVESPKEIQRTPRLVSERTGTNIERWIKKGKGGHFAALEQPEVLSHEAREFFRPLL